MQSILNLLKESVGIVLYWIWIFGRASVAAWSIVADKPLRSIPIGLLTALVVVALAAWASKPVMQELRPWLVGLIVLGMMGFFVFVYELLVTPARIYAEQRDRVNKLTERNKRLVNQLPSPGLNADQQKSFKAIIEPLAGRTVLIEYLDEPYSRSRSEELANSLRDAFRSAEWLVTMKKSDTIPVNALNIRNTGTPSGKGQLAVIEAFKAINISCGTWSSDIDVSDGRVELVIGEL